MNADTHHEKLDIERTDALRAYLLARGQLKKGEDVSMSILEGGVSNRTVLLKRPEGDDWVLKQALAKLRVKVDWYSDPKRIHREAAGMRYLARFAPEGSVTELVFEDGHEHVLAMEAVPQPHENWKTLLLRGELESEHVAQFAVLLGQIHREAFIVNEVSGEVAQAFADRSYFENLRLEPYYLYTAEQVPEAAEFLTDLVEATRQRPLTLVHGDYSPKNVLVYKDKLILLDHEVIHFGDPAFDVGFGMTHLLSKAHHLKDKRTDFAEAALTFWRQYRDTLGDTAFAPTLEPHAVRHTLGCLLARVAGRSPLEYLSKVEKQIQREVVLTLINDTPETVLHLVSRFTEGLSGG